MEAGAWGAFERLDLCPRPLCQDAGADRAGQGRGAGTAESMPRTSATKAPGLAESIDEAIAIGKGAGIPVHISHLKASGKAILGDSRPGAHAHRRSCARPVSR